MGAHLIDGAYPPIEDAIWGIYMARPLRRLRRDEWTELILTLVDLS